MSIELWAYDTPNGRKISVALEEMDLPYTVRIVDITCGEQFAPVFQRLSPNNRIPAIVDLEGLEGKPTTVFESGAILLYLAHKCGRFWPENVAEQVPVLEWLMWQVGGFGPMLGQVHHFQGIADVLQRRYGLERYMKETCRLYGVADRRLAQSEYFAGALSIADFAIVCWVWRHERHNINLEEFPNVRRWYSMMMARPAVERGFSVSLS